MVEPSEDGDFVLFYGVCGCIYYERFDHKTDAISYASDIEDFGEASTICIASIEQNKIVWITSFPIYTEEDCLEYMQIAKPR